MTTCSLPVCGTGTWTGPLPGDPDNSSILTATSEFGGVYLSWTLPNVNPFAIAHTRVFRATSSNFEEARQIAVVSSNQYFDSNAAEVIQTYYYWIQHVSINGTQLPPVGPVSAIPKPEIDKIVEQLMNKIELGHLATQLRSRINLITDLKAGITQINNTIVRENSILTQELQALRDDLTNAVAYINTQTQIAITERQALAESVTTLVAALNDNLTAAIQEEARVRAEETGALFGEKFMKIDLAGNVSGYGLAAYVDPQGNATSDFQVRADTFSIAPPAVHSRTPPAGGFNGKVWMDTSTNPPTPKWFNSQTNQWQTTPVKGAVPFIVKTTAETTPDGYTIPPGVYIDSAFITRLNARQIDTRGLTIRDNQGNVIFGAGVNLPVNRISGLGSLATQNSVTTSQVNGLGALATQNSVSASQVNGLGALATKNDVRIGSEVKFPDGSTMRVGDFVSRLSKIGSNNISTFMESAAIGSAYIGNAAVNTLKIADNAVTVPVVDQRFDMVYGSGSSVLVSQATITLSQPGMVFAIFCANQTYPSGGRYSVTRLVAPTGQPIIVGGEAMTTNIAVSNAVYLGAGTHTWQVFWHGQDNGVRIDARSLFVMGVMR